MKRILALAVLCLSIAPLRAQFVVHDPVALVQGIVNSVNEVVETSKTVTGIVAGVEEAKKIYDQSKWYYDKLKKVNNLIKDSKRVIECVNMLEDMVDIYTTNMSKFALKKGFTVDELTSYTAAYNRLLKKGSESIAELTKAISETSLTMTDKERMDLIRTVHNDITKLHTASLSLTNSIYVVSKYKENSYNEAVSTSNFFKK